jgi:lipopolysaccharide transport system permease protein
MPAVLTDAWRHRELLGILVVRNIKIRYKDSALGFLWTLLGPIFLILMYAAFLRLMRFSIPLPVLVTGIFVWQYLAMCLGDASHVILGNGNLIKKAAFPRMVLPASMVFANLVNFLLSLVVVAVYLAFVGIRPTAIAWLPLILLTQLALCLGVSLILSALNVFFRDTQQITGILTTAWFFLTPVIYPIELLDGLFRDPRLHVLYFANPMTGVLCAYRAVLLGADMPAPALWGTSFAVAWAVLVVGVVLFQRLQVRFADEL